MIPNAVRKNPRDFPSGFTMIEIVIILAILVMISSILFANFPTFSERVQLQRSAQDLAVAMRKAQNMAFAVRQANDPDGNSSTPDSFGIYLKKVDNFYKSFADFPGGSNKDKIFNPPSPPPPPPGERPDTVLETISFQKGITVSDITYFTAAGGSSVDDLHVTFSVPEARATAAKTSPPPEDQDGNKAEVTLKSSGGLTRKVVVSNTGQIYVK